MEPALEMESTTVNTYRPSAHAVLVPISLSHEILFAYIMKISWSEIHHHFLHAPSAAGAQVNTMWQAK